MRIEDRELSHWSDCLQSARLPRCRQKGESCIPRRTNQHTSKNPKRLQDAKQPGSIPEIAMVATVRVRKTNSPAIRILDSRSLHPRRKSTHHFGSPEAHAHLHDFRWIQRRVCCCFHDLYGCLPLLCRDILCPLFAYL